MKAFRKWCERQLGELEQLLYVDAHDWPESIIEQASDKAARLGLPHLVRTIPDATATEAIGYLAECLAASTPQSDLLTVQQAAERLNVSPRTVYDLIERGRLRCQRIGLGRGTIRIETSALRGCLATPEPTRFKHLSITG